MDSLLFILLLCVELSNCASGENNNFDFEKQWKLIAVLLSVGILIMLVVVVFLLCMILMLNSQHTSSARSSRSKQKTETDVESATPMLPVETVLDIEDVTGVNPIYKTKSSNLEISRTIQTTSCHTIQRGKMKMWQPRNEEDRARRLRVFVKKMIDPNDPVQQTMIKQELLTMIRLDKNPNILAFVGNVMEGDQISIISEYCEGGSLLQFVKQFRGSRDFTDQLIHARVENNEQNTDSYNWNNQVLDSNLKVFCTFDLLSISYQICSGMKCLSGNSFVHRQLSLRNIFITANKTIRIGNFSLARPHGNNAYYRINNVNLKIPISHRAPETLEDSRFVEQSDVWSFAVCLYELYSLGESPFDGLNDMKKCLERVGELQKPEYCHQEIYDFMLTCWNADQFKRPVFSKCVDFFEEHMKRFNVHILEQIHIKLEEASRGQAELVNWTRRQ
ncbi:hypothetical protein GCK72_020716 [Caenorhabditis remanei]|uniref:Protein kinase domain-containing protein n=1 Tax=Caenorhabditis remanei TaxID=31234 RepID=A0A6A5GHL1_CAERE|nr:hypothetical protein GCK72_020716 [Caenorhabditis remanei]KAF1754156.1 hypothetical protein GCK72_020716 [Caenorhabditis remanei]